MMDNFEKRVSRIYSLIILCHIKLNKSENSWVYYLKKYLF
jgi:hypothetical protein